MDTAVTEFTVVEVGFLSAFTCQFSDTRHRLTLTLALLNLIFQNFRHIGMDMQVVVHLLFDEIPHILVDAHAIGCHCQRTEFDLRLTLEHWFLHVDGNGCHDTRTDIAILVFTKEILDGTSNMFLEGTLVGTALCGMLSVDERIVLLAVLIGMGEGYLDVLAFEMNDGIKTVVSHAVIQQILQTMTGENTATIIHDGESCVQVGIVAEHVLHDVILELIVEEERIVRLEEDIGAVLVLCLLRLVIGHLAFLKGGLAHHTVTITAHLEVTAQGIDGLYADAI